MLSLFMVLSMVLISCPIALAEEDSLGSAVYPYFTDFEGTEGEAVSERSWNAYAGDRDQWGTVDPAKASMVYATCGVCNCRWLFCAGI